MSNIKAIDDEVVLLITCRPLFLKLTKYVLPMFAAVIDHYPKAAPPDGAEDRTQEAFHPPGPLPIFP